ncbi:MAG: putative DNA binding domain-containing protein [Planctomycetia bacterium]|nr:putative DNA binding domain-containing protein [Planctomycetia bacterium]
MATTPAQIDLWIQSRSEHQRLEFKEAKTQYDNTKLFKYCVALANEGGGILLLGVTDKLPRRVVGSAAFNNVVEMAEKIFTMIGFRVDVEEVIHPDGRVVVFHIPSRPRGTAYHLDGAYLMRSGEELVPMSEDRLRKIFAEGQPDWLEEPARTGLTPQEVIDLLDTQNYFALLQRPYPTTQNAVLDYLQAERLIDKTDSTYSIRRMGAILLARRFTDFSDISRKAVRVVVYQGNSKVATKLDQTWESGYAVGFQPLVAFVMSQLPQNEIVEEAIRRKVKLVPEIAIRELVANAIIHQDFKMTGASVMIEVYTNRVEISNPGEPIVPVERFIDGYQSRNERFADLMRRMHICEEKSSGIDQVITAAETFQLPAPDFVVGHRRTSVIILGHKPFQEMDREARIRACYQHCVLRYVMHENMTNQSLRKRFRLPDSKSAIVSQIITAAVEAVQIKADEAVGSSKKLAHYLPHWA